MRVTHGRSSQSEQHIANLSVCSPLHQVNYAERPVIVDTYNNVTEKSIYN